MKKQLPDQLVQRLTARMDIHRIFLFSYPHLEAERQHLLLVVNPVNGLAPKTMAPIVSLCFSDTEAIPFDMILTGAWQNQLKQGSLYYTYASLPQHELHAASKKGTPIFAHKTITGLLELAELNYEKCRKSSDEFKEGVHSFLARGDFGQATFMLHQYLELRLKGFLSTVGVNGGKAHNIEHLLKRLSGVAPQLLEIFPSNSPSIDLLRLLDESYTKAKRQETVAITEEEFHILLGKCELAQFAMDGLVEAMVARVRAYREQAGTDTAKQPKSVGALLTVKPKTQPIAASSQLICEDFAEYPWPQHYIQDVNTLLSSLVKNHNPEQITLLNYRMGGFSGNYLTQRVETVLLDGSKIELYLVIVMKNKGAYHFRCIRNGDASAMVLYLNENHLSKKLATGDRFAHALWTNGRVLRRKSTFEPTYATADVDWQAQYESASDRWKNAKACMQNINKAIQTSPLLKLDTGLLLLNNLLEVGVDTYLQLALGFVPHRLHVTERIDWSGVDTLKLIDFFNPKTSIELQRFHLAAVPEAVWWENIPLGLSDTPLSFHRGRAQEFVSFFEGICEGVLKDMEGRLNTPNS